jgi:hypothetical protein
MEETQMVLAARQFLRAIRGERSQIAFARRLGYKGNPIADWEAGRRTPTASEVWRACQLVGLDVTAAFTRFHVSTASTLGKADDAGVSAWLASLRGSTPLHQIAATSGYSRFAISRWLSGQTKPRLHEFFLLVEAITGRVSDLVFAFVPEDKVPVLQEQHAARQASRRLAFEEPWTEAVLRVIETRSYVESPAHRPGFIAESLGISMTDEARCVEKLLQAKVISWNGTHYTNAAPLTVDTLSAPERLRTLKAHWAGVGLERLKSPRNDQDLLSYNVFSVSEADYQKIRELHRAYFREVRTIVAASEPPEVAALINVQLIRW